MRSRFRPGYSAVACAVVFLGLVCGATAASAVVTFTVDSVLDQIDDDTADGVCHTAASTCTLRAAVMQANLVSGAGVTIVLPAGIYVLTRPAQGANGADNGDLNFTAPASGDPLISIIGAGQASTIIDANQIDRVLKVDTGRSAAISNLTIRNGYLIATASSGGGIRNDGALALSQITVSGNAAIGAVGLGGGIANDGQLSIANGTISENSADQEGGGIYSRRALNMSACVVSQNNSAKSGGGIYSFGNNAILIMDNSTISLNDANGDGGGIWANEASIYNSTIVGNGADADADVNGGIGGGVFAQTGSFSLSNTLVAGNTLFNQPIYDDCFGTLTSYRRNLFGEVSIFCSIVVGGGDGWGLLNSLTFLGQLEKNGGPTRTIALLPGSNAIDAGDSTLGCTGPSNEVLTVDQRGAPRAWGLRCDVGAYESGPLFFDGFESGDLAAW